jgi:hypothetical protein
MLLPIVIKANFNYWARSIQPCQMANSKTLSLNTWGSINTQKCGSRHVVQWQTSTILKCFGKSYRKTLLCAFPSSFQTNPSQNTHRNDYSTGNGQQVDFFWEGEWLHIQRLHFANTKSNRCFTGNGQLVQVFREGQRLTFNNLFFFQLRLTLVGMWCQVYWWPISEINTGPTNKLSITHDSHQSIEASHDHLLVPPTYFQDRSVSHTFTTIWKRPSI